MPRFLDYPERPIRPLELQGVDPKAIRWWAPCIKYTNLATDSSVKTPWDNGNIYPVTFWSSSTAGNALTSLNNTGPRPGLNYTEDDLPTAHYVAVEWGKTAGIRQPSFGSLQPGVAWGGVPYHPTLEPFAIRPKVIQGLSDWEVSLADTSKLSLSIHAPSTIALDDDHFQLTYFFNNLPTADNDGRQISGSRRMSDGFNFSNDNVSLVIPSTHPLGTYILSFVGAYWGGSVSTQLRVVIGA